MATIVRMPPDARKAAIRKQGRSTTAKIFCAHLQMMSAVIWCRS